LSDIGSARYGHLPQKCLLHSASRPVLATLIGAIAWSGHFATIPLSLLPAALLYKAQSRAQAYAIFASYYFGATWPLIPGAKAFFGAKASILDGILLFVIAVLLLAVPAALLFTRNGARLPFSVPAILILGALPPVGIIGWASPLLSAGVLFPGTGWLGIISLLGIVASLGRFPLHTAVLAGVLALLSHALYKPSALPPGWQAINTALGGAGQGDPDFLAEFEAHQQMQETIRQSDARVLLFPEHVVTQWNQATEAFWQESLDSAARHHNTTVLIGAGIQRGGGSHAVSSKRYYNALIARGPDTQAVYYQRIPVPIGMWRPLNSDGVPLNLLGPGTISVQGQRAAVLICYEQLLVWPFLSSVFERPTILVTAANDYWAKATPIPEIQDACAKSLARLFGLPVLSAVNQ
jgi:predicted amidohydrolase